MSKSKVMAAMSGGVDSSVAAALLIEQGYEVSGGIMKLWNNSVEDAQNVADKLGIPLYIFDFSKEFKEDIADYFVDSYTSGKTPNPCVVCNKKFKFGVFLNKALELGYDYIATGHYAKIRKDETTNFYNLVKSDNIAKDQSYFLYNMTQHELSHTLFPIADYKKEFIRQKAEELGLNVAKKKDSQDICFVPDGDYVKFIEGYLSGQSLKNLSKPGDYVDLNGDILGKHKGLINYTIGQRNGLGMGFGKKMYVISIDVSKNTVVLGDDAEVFKNSLSASEATFVNERIFNGSLNCDAKIRYGAKPVRCKVTTDENVSGQINVIFEQPVRAVTAGQSVVFYDDDRVLGGAVIL